MSAEYAYGFQGIKWSLLTMFTELLSELMMQKSFQILISLSSY